MGWQWGHQPPASASEGEAPDGHPSRWGQRAAATLCLVGAALWAVGLLVADLTIDGQDHVLAAATLLLVLGLPLAVRPPRAGPARASLVLFAGVAATVVGLVLWLFLGLMYGLVVQELFGIGWGDPLREVLAYRVATALVGVGIVGIGAGRMRGGVRMTLYAIGGYALLLSALPVHPLLWGSWLATLPIAWVVIGVVARPTTPVEHAAA